LSPTRTCPVRTQIDPIVSLLADDDAGLIARAAVPEWHCCPPGAVRGRPDAHREAHGPEQKQVFRKTSAIQRGELVDCPVHKPSDFPRAQLAFRRVVERYMKVGELARIVLPGVALDSLAQVLAHRKRNDSRTVTVKPLVPRKRQFAEVRCAVVDLDCAVGGALDDGA
jgi:hypothetical protein